MAFVYRFLCAFMTDCVPAWKPTWLVKVWSNCKNRDLFFLEVATALREPITSNLLWCFRDIFISTANQLVQYRFCLCYSFLWEGNPDAEIIIWPEMAERFNLCAMVHITWAMRKTRVSSKKHEPHFTRGGMLQEMTLSVRFCPYWLQGVAFCSQGAALYQVLFSILHGEGGVVKLSTTRTWDS